TQKPRTWKDRYFGLGDLHVYDVRELLEGKAAEGAALAPTKTLPLSIVVSRLVLAPDGSALFCLETQEQKLSRLLRLDAAKLEQVAEVVLGPKSRALYLTRDGKTLYTCRDALPPPEELGVKPTGLFGGSLDVFDAATLTRTRSVPLDATPLTLVA